MIINIVRPKIEDCVIAYRQLSINEPEVQLFISNEMKCRHHYAVTGIVISNYRIANGRTATKENVSLYVKENDLSKDNKTNLERFISDENLHSNATEQK